MNDGKGAVFRVKKLHRFRLVQAQGSHLNQAKSELKLKLNITGLDLTKASSSRPMTNA